MRKRSEILERFMSETHAETKARVWKAMSCKHYYNGGDCRKGLPGTPCDPEKCVAWEKNPEIK